MPSSSFNTASASPCGNSRSTSRSAYRHRWQVTGSILVVGLAVSFALLWFFRDRDRRLIQRRFNAAAVERTNVLENFMQQSVESLIAVGAFYAGSDSVDRDEFHNFADRLLKRSGNQALALEWLPLVTDDDRDTFERRLRATVGATACIKQLDELGYLMQSDAGDLYFPIEFVEPIDDVNLSAFGFDHYSDPPRTLAMERARDTGRPIASDRLLLFRVTGTPGQRSGVLIFMPVFRNGASVATVRERRQSLRGYVACTVRFGEFFEQIATVWPGFDIELFLEDVTGSEPVALYAHAIGDNGNLSISMATEQAIKDVKKNLHVYGRDYRVTCRPSQSYIESQRTIVTPSVFLACVTITILVAAFVNHLQAVSRRSRVAEQTTRAVLQSTLDPVVCIDARGKIQFASNSVHRVFGWQPSELVGNNVSVLMPEPHRSSHDGYLNRHRSTGESRLLNQSRELEAQRRDGTPFPCEICVSEVQSTRGGGARYVGIVRDITARKQAEQELVDLQKRFVESAHQAGKAEIATSVLHNVGNVVNSVNVSVDVIKKRVGAIGLGDLRRVTELIDQRRENLGDFISNDARGRHLPDFLAELVEHMSEEETAILEEIDALTTSVEHVKEIIMVQQSHATGAAGLTVETDLRELMETAIRINSASADRHELELVCEFDSLPPASIDRNKLLQIVVNLISNAKHALLADQENTQKRIVVRLYRATHEMAGIEVEDNGVGISEENLTRIFAYGFTTKKEGHGFGLHSAVLAAKEMDGELTAHSDGEGQGALFRVSVPFAPPKSQEKQECKNKLVAN